MNKLDFAAINQALDAGTLVPQWLPHGRRQVNEWISPNPTRDDRNPGSFTINLHRGVWKDYATGDGGSDLVSLYAYLFHGNDQGAAAKELAANAGVKIGDPVTRTAAAAAAKVADIEDAKPVPIIPVPFSAPAATFKHLRHGEPSAVWTYRDADGETMMHVCRFDPEGERKQIVPRSWCKRPDGTEGWNWRGITGRDALRPLYGIDRLVDGKPDGDVVLVEGEKTADAARQFFGEGAVVVSWMGGVETADRVDVRPLAGRRVYLWPDFDSLHYKDNHPRAGELMDTKEQPGVRAMLELFKALRGVASSVRMITYTPGEAFPHGWDLADAVQDEWTAVQVLEYMVKYSADPAAVAAGKPPAPPPPPGAAATAEDEPQGRSLQETLDVVGFPNVGEKLALQNTIENLQHLMAQYAITARYNVVSKDIEVRIPGRRFSQDNHMGASIATIGSLCAMNKLARSDLVDYMMVIADANQYNPAGVWIDSKPWDGVDRIQDLADTLDAENPKLAYQLLRRWMIGAVGCVFNPEGMSMQGALVLQGPQNTGKTTWFWSLSNRNKQLAKEGVALNPSDRDSVKGAISYWLVELGELDATFRKSDVAALKSFITKDSDEIRLPFARAASKFARRTAFVGTVNPAQFLHDDTGNRRYWTIRHGAKLNGMHHVDMQQAWAQVKTLWAAGEQHRLTTEEMAELSDTNAQHLEANPIEEFVQSKFQWGQERSRAMSASDVLVAIGYDKPNNKQCKDCGAILRKLTGGEPRKTNGRMVFMMPPPVKAERAFSHYDESRPF